MSSYPPPPDLPDVRPGEDGGEYAARKAEQRQWMKDARMRCEAATPEPWRDDNGYRVRAAIHGPDDVVCDAKVGDGTSADVAFIVNARADLPRALDIIDGLEKAIALAGAQGPSLAAVMAEREALIAWVRGAMKWAPCLSDLPHIIPPDAQAVVARILASSTKRA